MDAITAEVRWERNSPLAIQLDSFRQKHIETQTQTGKLGMTQEQILVHTSLYVCFYAVGTSIWSVLPFDRRSLLVISELLERHSKAKRTRAPAYSRALRRN